MKKILFSLVTKVTILSMLLSFQFIPFTNSYLNDQEEIAGITISADYWDTQNEETNNYNTSVDPSPTLTPNPTATPSPTISPEPTHEEPNQYGFVVINEIMWMGSSASTADEWIELHNTTDHEINIGQWTLDNVKDSENRKLMIPANKSIPSHGYFLIANYPKTSENSALNVNVDVVSNLEFLNSNNGNIVLKNIDGIIIDQARSNSWPAGINGINKQSMERNDIPGDGTQINSWHTCISDGCKSTSYWDSPNNSNYGTPKAANLSENDPTSPDYLKKTLTLAEPIATPTPILVLNDQNNTSTESAVPTPTLVKDNKISTESATPTPTITQTNEIILTPTITVEPTVTPSIDPSPTPIVSENPNPDNPTNPPSTPAQSSNAAPEFSTPPSNVEAPKPDKDKEMPPQNPIPTNTNISEQTAQASGEN